MSFNVKRRVKLGAKTRKSSSFDDGGLTVGDLPALRRKRTIALNRLRRTLEVAESAKEDCTHLDAFLAQYSVVNKLSDDFEKAHFDIISIIDTTIEAQEDAVREEFDEIYFSIVTIHRQLTQINEVINSSQSSSVHSRSCQNVKLPKIKIPVFSGSIKTWPEFYDIFNSLVHNNESITDTERMHYLISSLSGDAHALIRTYPIQGIYYREAYETLVLRYQNNRELAFSCWKEILDINFKSKSPIEFRRVLDLFCENLKLLKGLELPIESWDFILCYHLLSKLDQKIRCDFEETHACNELPKFDKLLKFLYSKCEALVRDTHFSSNAPATINRVQQNFQPSFKSTNKNVKSKPTTVFLTNETFIKPQTSNSKSQSLPSTSARTHTPTHTPALQPAHTYTPSSQIVKCSYCSENHSVNQCKGFAQTTVSERIDYAKNNRWCFNCLKPSHTVKECKSIFRCQKCRQRHHTLLHQEEIDEPTTSTKVVSASQVNDQVSVLTSIGDHSVVLLSTAIIQIRDSAGNFQSFRALIDSGSQAHFITERVAERLGLNRLNISQCIRGLGKSFSAVSGAVKIDIGFQGKTLFSLSAYTLPLICGKMPSTRIDKSSWSHLQNLQLADPNCHKPGPIDILLGAEIFASLLLPGSVSGTHEQPSALNSVFGWLIMGNTKCEREEIQTFFINEDKLLNDQMKLLWELETFDRSSKILTPDEKRCEEMFTASHSRDPTGRYVVSLPFRDEESQHNFLGSRDKALRCFHSIERRLAKDPVLQEQYVNFMKDYLENGHMSLVPPEELGLGKYYIPHHCVQRPDSSTTKLRVVFNASSKDARGVSLNDVLLIGPKLQSNIAEILLNFRIHFVVFTADMRQMYRMIWLDVSDREYQRIFWRFSSSHPVQEYRLNTVTYGVSSAPFLACRTIKQLISDEGEDLPLASKVLSSQVYIDDIVTGFESLEKALQAKSEVIELLKRGNFELRKWASNSPEVLADLPPEHCLTAPVTLDVDENNTLKVLGLKWNPHSDCFFFTVNPQQRKCTKRNILSEIARIFDPLGFLSPLTIIAKILVQRLWVLGEGWDADPPEDIIKFWNCYLAQLPLLTQLQIPRCLSVRSIKSCELHGFSDSSEKAYGAVVYLRIIDVHENVQVFFVCSKGRVAPIKSTSLPRLELCGAVVLADLLKFVKQIYLPVFPCSDIFAWSDSTIVLAWLRSHPSRWKAFVANRVSRILDAIPEARWNHVVSEDNPADVVARGQLPSALINNSLWWAGPSWLSQPRDTWPASSLIQSHEEEVYVATEERKVVLTCTDNNNTVEATIFENLLNRFSSLSKLLNVLAYMYRFINNCRHSNKVNHNFITNAERHNALMQIVKYVQGSVFSNEIANINLKKPLSKPFRKLNPFIDQLGILRVGGRISRSGLEFEHKHPAFLPTDHPLTFLIIDDIHRNHLHPGINTTHFLLLQQFWIISAKRAIRRRLTKCVQCFRTNPKPLQPFMSDLPSFRVNQVKPFSKVGVDFGGPFRIRLGPRRGGKIDKAYLCLFVCLATKAVHLEVVSTLSTDGFLAALRRFVARRGRCNVIHADCGTNFVGARTQLMSLMQHASKSEKIHFKFNSPSAPHFGGVWEIQIKAAKSLLFRVVGDQVLSFEELTTLFTQIEAVLNSRPLYSISSDPNDLSVLTPGHFLTLEPLTAVPDEDLSSVNLNRLSRWQLLQSIHQNFWFRWKNEYLNSLTQRAKWTNNSQPLKIGSVVIIKDDNRVPLQWPLARVLDLLPGADGIARIALVKLSNQHVVKRPLVKLCPLPVED